MIIIYVFKKLKTLKTFQQILQVIIQHINPATVATTKDALEQDTFL